MGALRLIGPEGRSPSGQCAVYSRVRVHLPEWRIHCHRPGNDSELGRAAPPASVPPGASVARSFERGRLSAPRRRRDGRPGRCRDARIGPLHPSKGGCRPRHWQARGPRVRFSRLPASARWIGQAPGPGLPAWAAPVRASKRGCAVRSGLSGTMAVACEHFCTGLRERLAWKDNDGQLHWRL